VIDTDGCVREPRVVQGAGIYDADAAVKAYSQYLFQPATLDGKPVSVNFPFVIHFR
jgi:hypothetical protein